MHVAIIMNGNGRWAMKRGLPPTAVCIQEDASSGLDSRLQLRIVIDYSEYARPFQRALGYSALEPLAGSPDYQPVITAS